MIPYITDVAPLIEMLTPYTDTIWIYGLSVEDRSGKNWQNVEGILHNHFPDLKDRIESVLFADAHSYWDEQR